MSSSEINKSKKILYLSDRTRHINNLYISNQNYGQDIMHLIQVDLNVYPQHDEYVKE